MRPTPTTPTRVVAGEAFGSPAGCGDVLMQRPFYAVRAISFATAGPLTITTTMRTA
jgi:hypothetical protein